MDVGRDCRPLIKGGFYIRALAGVGPPWVGVPDHPLTDLAHAPRDWDLGRVSARGDDEMSVEPTHHHAGLGKPVRSTGRISSIKKGLSSLQNPSSFLAIKSTSHSFDQTSLSSTPRSYLPTFFKHNNLLSLIPFLFDR